MRIDSPAAWRVADPAADTSWIFSIDEAARAQVLRAVRGGIRGLHHDQRCRAFDRRQAAALGMSVAAQPAARTWHR